MFMLIAVKQGQQAECVPGFFSRRDAQHEADRLNALPREWQEPDGRRWQRVKSPATWPISRGSFIRRA